MKQSKNQGLKEGKPSEKDVLSQEDIQKGIKNIEEADATKSALETNNGKQNGAEPKVFQGKQKYHT